MSKKSGSTIIFITLLCFVVLGLGALVAWQYHRQAMEGLILENLSLKQKIQDLEKGSLIKEENGLEEQEASDSSQLLESDESLDFLQNSATFSATGSAF